MRASKRERFDHYSPDRPADGCWEWTGVRNEKGYGQLRTMTESGSALERAHRLAWEFEYGAIPKGMLVMHRCDNPPCVRPDHLFIGTPADNMADKIAKGRAWRHPRRDLRKTVQRGEASGKAAKLTAEQVRQIRARADTSTFKALGREFGVTGSQIGMIVRRKSWAHVE
jgi:hypothetical protein